MAYPILLPVSRNCDDNLVATLITLDSRSASRCRHTARTSRCLGPQVGSDPSAIDRIWHARASLSPSAKSNSISAFTTLSWGVVPRRALDTYAFTLASMRWQALFIRLMASIERGSILFCMCYRLCAKTRHLSSLRDESVEALVSQWHKHALNNHLRPLVFLNATDNTNSGL